MKTERKITEAMKALMLAARTPSTWPASQISADAWRRAPSALRD